MQSEILLKGTVRQEITKSNDGKFFYIYQFETIDNNDYLEIIDVYSRKKIPNIKENPFVEIPITITYKDTGILFELKTNNIIKDK